MFDKYIFDTYHEQIVKTVKGFIFKHQTKYKFLIIFLYFLKCS
ncbi:Uncharacterised protein [Streptococcus dysgalactiae]|nr:Uncharacterised protein [Streptococcus dysgalactiae]